MRKARSKMTKTERDRSEHWRNDARKFMHDRFRARCLWEMDGPENTDVDWMMFFAFDGGTALIMTWLAGGWSIWTDGAEHGEYDKTEAALRRQIEERKHGQHPLEAAAPLLLGALIKALHELHHELDQRKNSGNDEDYADLEALCQECARAIVAAAPNAIKPHSLGAAAVTAITPRMANELMLIGITDLESPLERFLPDAVDDGIGTDFITPDGPVGNSA